MAALQKLPKAPKAPKASATAKQHEAYHQKYKAWEDKCSAIKKENEELVKLQKKTEDYKAGKPSRTTKKRRR